MASISFGNQRKFYPSAGSALTITSTGTLSLIVSDSVTFSGANATDFSAYPENCGQAGASLTLTQNQTCTYHIVFTPQTTGAESATLTITSNDVVNSPQSVTLTGTGVVIAGCGAGTDGTGCGAAGIPPTGAASNDIVYGVSTCLEPVSGNTNAGVYCHEAGATNAATWCAAAAGTCGGDLNAQANPCSTGMVQGTRTSHKRWYLTADLDCTANSGIFAARSYVDVDLNGFTIKGYVTRNGSLFGFHLFNGAVTVLAGFPNLLGGIYLTSLNVGTFTNGGGDQNVIHHLTVTNLNTTDSSRVIHIDQSPAAPGGGFTEDYMFLFNITGATNSNAAASRMWGLDLQSGANYLTRWNTWTVPADAAAAQGLNFYGAAPNCQMLDNEVTVNFNTTGLDTPRALLMDGNEGQNCKVAGNYVHGATPGTVHNGRALRMRDTSTTEVYGNDFEDCGYWCVHGGEPDISSVPGELATINIHHNTIGLRASTDSSGHNDPVAYEVRIQRLQYFMFNHITSAAGAYSANQPKLVDSWSYTTFPMTTGSVDSAAKTVICTGCNFNSGSGAGNRINFYGAHAAPARTYLKFAGFNNAANNGMFLVSSVDSNTQITLSDPNNLLVTEASTANPSYYFGAQAWPETNYLTVNSTNLYLSTVNNPQQGFITYCGDSGATTLGSGTFAVASPCQPLTLGAIGGGTVPPTAAWVFPAFGGLNLSGVQTWSAAVAGGTGPYSTAFTLDGSNISGCTAVVGASPTCIFDTAGITSLDGTHTLNCTATDANTNTGTCGNITFVSANAITPKSGARH